MAHFSSMRMCIHLNHRETVNLLELSLSVNADSAFVCWLLCLVSIVLVHVVLLIKLKETPKSGDRLGSNEVFLSANWHCAPHQQFLLLGPCSSLCDQRQKARRRVGRQTGPLLPNKLWRQLHPHLSCLPPSYSNLQCVDTPPQ